MITPNQNFKHGSESYEKGQSYEVPDEDGEYFTACGWVGEPNETGQEISLDIQDGQIGHSSEVN